MHFFKFLFLLPNYVSVCVEAYPCLTTFFKNVITKMVKKGVTI